MCALFTWNKICLPSFYRQVTFGNVDLTPKLWIWTDWNWKLSQRKNRSWRTSLSYLIFWDNWGSLLYGICLSSRARLLPLKPFTGFRGSESVQPIFWEICFRMGQGAGSLSLLKVPGILEMLRNWGLQRVFWSVW